MPSRGTWRRRFRKLGRLTPWVLAIIILLWFIGDHISASRNITLDVADRLLVRLYAGGAWLVFPASAQHGDPGSGFYIGVAEYTRYAASRPLHEYSGAYHARSIPAWWIGLTLLALWIVLARKGLLSAKRRTPVLLWLICAAIITCLLLYPLSFAFRAGEVLPGERATTIEGGALVISQGLAPNPAPATAFLFAPSSYHPTTQFLLDRYDLANFVPRRLIPWLQTGTSPKTFSAGLGAWSGGNATWELNIPLWLIAVPLVPIAWWLKKNVDASRLGLCRKCHYALTGLPPTAPCPECGTPITAK